jgi:hypothetical protein
MTPDDPQHRARRYAARMHAAETLERAATNHDARADRFDTIGQHALAAQERGRARGDRLRAKNARLRAGVGQPGGVTSDDAAEHRRRRHDAHLRAAETHDRAAARHDDAAAKFLQVGDRGRAEHERVLAYEQRRKAELARRRAIAELQGDV